VNAVLFVREPNKDWAFLGHDRSPVLLPFFDRSLLQHAVEALVSRGCKRIGIATMTAIEPIRALVGDGERWGAKIEVYPLRALSELPALLTANAPGESVIVADAERLPTAASSADAELTGGGWLLLSRDQSKSSIDVVEQAGGDVFLDVTTPEAYLDSWNRAVMSGNSGLVKTGRSQGENVVVGRGTRIHPSAQIEGPAYIGERCLISPEAKIGPNTYIGADSIVEDGAILADCAVFPHTYVGPRLEIRRKLVYRSTAYDIDKKVSLDAIEEFLLGGTQKTTQIGPSVLERVVALGSGTLLLPVTLLGAVARLFSKPADHQIGHRNVTMDFVTRVAPGMWSVVAGRQCLVGAPSLDAPSRRDVERLAPGLLETVPEGLISDAYVRFGPRPSLDELWASVAFAAAARDRRSRRSLVVEYLCAAFGFSNPSWTRGSR